ncbi:MAG: gamma-glutamyltransferase [Chloroflexi bacterium]|nr:gamma-glutamyltransferase [Chloroflexota bacterium]MCL5109147.1 gamma-glutamyltransferase [Chloroflexota bacterium]
MVFPGEAVRQAHRPVVMSKRGMVVAGHPLAALAGTTALQAGGNAVDAALATAAALNVVEPHMSGMGGDGFIMVYDRSQGTVQVVNATGAAPFAATRETFADGIPMKGMRSVSTPGLVAGWLGAHQRYGRLPVESLFASAIGWAREGFPVGHRLAEYMSAEPALLNYPSSRAIFAPAGKPLRPGELLVQRDLARTLTVIAREGAAAFYTGEIGQQLVRFSEQQGGLLSPRDLAECRAHWQEPISVDYRGYTVYNAPPNSSGLTMLQMLNLVGLSDLRALGWLSPAAVQLMVEAKKLAFADRERYLADPEWVDVPVEGLLSKAYARERAELIDLRRAAQSVAAGDPWSHQSRGSARGERQHSRGATEREDTTCFVVVDGEGNAVCQLQSIQSAFGSALVADGTGILLNNRMTYWHLEEGHVDCLAPGKRVRHTMNPVMVFKDGLPRLVMGTPGADTQVQTNLQVLTHVLDFGHNVQEAVEAPRWRHLQNATESTVPHTCQDQLQLEARFAPETAKALRELGQPVTEIAPWEAMGSEVMIEIDPASGVLMGGADPRRDAYAIGI